MKLSTRATEQNVFICVRFVSVIPIKLATNPSVDSESIAVKFIQDMTTLYVVPSAPSGQPP